MLKKEFLEELRKRLSALPAEELEERIEFYSEMIDDRIEEGFSEEDAVSAVSSVCDTSETPVGTVAEADMPEQKEGPAEVQCEEPPYKKYKGWMIVLLLVGAPIWVPIVLSAVSSVFSLYGAVWAVIISVQVCFVALAAAGIGGIAGGAYMVFAGHPAAGLATIWVCLVCLGLSVFVFFAAKFLADGTVSLSKKAVLGIKNCFRKREAA